MSDLTRETGKRIHDFRKSRGLNQEELASLIFKSKATLSKYEKGEISIDLDTLKQLALALHVRMEQLLPPTIEGYEEISPARVPTFFKGLTQFFSYMFDGRDNHVLRCVFDLHALLAPNRQQVALYMNFKDKDHYQNAENIYFGYIEHFDVLSIIELVNQNTPTEKASIQIPSPFMEADTRWGLWNGVSSRPFMPVAGKMLFSKKLLKEDAAFLKSLRLTKEDIRRLKYYNFFTVV
ncbi:MAG: helix-turn-helix domain-containing protein [Acidaminococcus sp.]|jgi:transcriptional regulator with XRE-family HTH domain|nr:helix-turn-helix domain-containing protein [Acidaminococcus sp.]MCI2115533.1 helix-turn-helix domain-containing protein [Acidaminococcus sp.]MCI2117666.1 helix-turn-helix domain-containing protein [Acidaminococcus sp.]